MFYSSDCEVGGERLMHAVDGRSLDVETGASEARTLALAAMNEPSITRVSNGPEGGDK